MIDPTLLKLNDLHGYLEPHPELVRAESGWRFERLGGVARIARIFEEARAEGPCLTLDNGDTFHGTRVAVASRGALRPHPSDAGHRHRWSAGVLVRLPYARRDRTARQFPDHLKEHLMDSVAARDFWNSRYDRQDNLTARSPTPSWPLRSRDSMTALAVADGEGRNGVWLADQGLAATTNDTVPRAIEKALALAKRQGVALNAQLADLETWAWPQAAFDVVVALFIQFAPPAQRDRIFQSMKAAVKPCGLILLQGYRPEQIAYGTGGPGQVENLYPEDLHRDAFAGFDILNLKSHDSDVSEGAGHSGRSALIDLVARRP